MRFVLVALTLMAALQPEAKARSQSMRFTYQSLQQPFPKWNCTYEKEAQLPYGYLVKCPLARRTTAYRVHLKVSYYPKTNLGLSAYEILYWVTDVTDPARPVSDSSTTWIHQDSPNAKPTVLQLSQGIENDAAYLQLVIDNRS